MKTLYLRIVVTVSLVMLISSLLAFIVSNIYYHYSLKPYNDSKLTEIADNIKTFYEHNPELALKPYLDHIGSLGYQLYLINDEGTGSFYGGAYRVKELAPEVISNVLSGQVYHGISEFPSQLFVTGFFDNKLVNSIGVPIQVQGVHAALFVRPDVEVQFGEMRIFFAILLVLAILLSILLVFISTRYIVKPIVKLTEATKLITKGNYNLQLAIRRRDEIGILANQFSQMARSIEQLEEMRQEFVSNVSHEMQSPLASIQGFSQTLQSADLTEEQRKNYLAIIENESRRMSQLSKQLLTLASLDKVELDKTSCDVAAQIKQALFLTEWSWREKDLAIDMELHSTIVQADEKMLYQVWMNLITNSIKFTGHGGTLSIRTRQTEQECLVEFTDTGIGIAENDLPNIFNRFYRADKARDRKEGSSGLGLAITKKIIDLHNGHIEASSQLGQGTTIQIRLPRL